MKANLQLWVAMLLLVMAYAAKKGKKEKKAAPQWKTSSMPDKAKISEFVHEGKNVHLDCRAQGHPKPSIKWTKNGQDVVASDSVEVKKFYLNLKSVTTDKSGNYTCVVNNKHGQIEWTFIVVVEAKIWPLVIDGPKNITGVVGSTVTFECQVLNDPKAAIRWQRMINRENRDDGSPLAEFLPDTDDPQFLTLNEITKGDEREYRCMVGNVWGLIYSSAWLRVVEAITGQEIPRSLEGDIIDATNNKPSRESRRPDDNDDTSPDDWVNVSDDMDPGQGRDESENMAGLDMSENDLDSFVTSTKDPKNGNKRRKNEMKKGRKNKKKTRVEEIVVTSTNSATTADSWPTTTFKLWPTSEKKAWPTNPTWLTNAVRTWPTSTLKTWPPIATEKLPTTTSIEIWNFETKIENVEFSDSRNPAGKNEDTVEAENTDSERTADKEVIQGSISSWTIYTIVGAIGGVILLIGLVAITLTLCCKRDEDGVYKSTSV